MNEVDVFLEHYGVKGQRWGVRKAFRKGKKGDWQKRTGGQQLGLIGGALVGAQAAHTIVAQILNKGLRMANVRATPGTNLAIKAGMQGVDVAGGILGARFTRNVLQKNGSRHMSRIKFEDD